MASNYYQSPNQYYSPHNMYNNVMEVQTQNFRFPSPNFQQQSFGIPAQRPQNPRFNEAIERIERAVVKARRDLLGAKECASSWKVSQAALLSLKAESWESLGCQMQQVPSLHSLILTEGKINAFIHCFVAARRIATLYEMETAICQNEGVQQFEDLELGPLVRCPLVVHYFSISSDQRDVFKITTEEILSDLSELLDKRKGKEVGEEELLDLVAKKRSITRREQLCVRIQDLGMYINCIRQVKLSGGDVLKKCLDGLKIKASKRIKKRPLFSSQKKELDDRFCAISERVKSFSSKNENFGGTHTRFTPSNSENDDSDNDEYEDYQGNDEHGHDSLQVNMKSYETVSSCPYPSAAEEMTRLGLNSETNCSTSTMGGIITCNTDNESSKRKRKSGSVTRPVSIPFKIIKRDSNGIYHSGRKIKGVRNQHIDDLTLSDDSTSMFVTTWKDLCKESSVDEVFQRMLQFYNTRKRKKVTAVFSTYPFVGLLNVAVASIKCGMWDSMYDDLQIFNGGVGRTRASSDDVIHVEVESLKEEEAVNSRENLTLESGFKIEEILEKICCYIGLDLIPSNENDPTKKKLFFLKKLINLQSWLVKEFVVMRFESLGYGDFLIFLDKNIHMLPPAFMKWLIGDTCEKVSVEACMLKPQLDLLLLQASNSLPENDKISEQTLSDLLIRQFPSVSFKLVTDSLEDIREVMKEKVKNIGSNSKCVLFSATLSGINCLGQAACQNGAILPVTNVLEVMEGHKLSGAATSRDAVEVLLRAPMLTDLHLWSHWDIVFSPSLGSLIGWLLNEVNSKELLCLVTKGGNVIRIDHSATVQSFLEAFLQGSSYGTAVNLLSVFALYGGERNVPLSLLKCHARQAFEVLAKNTVQMELHDHYLLNEMQNDTSIARKVVPIASRFVLDCLGYLPSEFCSFAADILLAGLQPLVRDAPLAILSECKLVKQRLILHDAGMSLGIAEWINDHHEFCLSNASGLLAPFESLYLNVASLESSWTANVVIKSSSSSKDETVVSPEAPRHDEDKKEVDHSVNKISSDSSAEVRPQNLTMIDSCNDPSKVIESIRQEEFGLSPSLSDAESIMLSKQHARLGRALHCLSHELYSQDSHFILELVQNADDNIYPADLEPTLTFILQEKDIVVLNNELGFSEDNIRALCDVGNSTKKGHSAGYIGKKGIGFKSVFRVTDAPEIHSNGFHIKFDITEGQIGFVLPTVVPARDVNSLDKLVSADADQIEQDYWKTCIVLPFKSNMLDGFSMNSIMTMFSDLHPSLLLFLHRLRCIKFKNVLTDSLIVMKKVVLGNGIVSVSHEKETTKWLVVSQKLKANIIRPDVETTEISIAFTLQETDNGDYIPHLNQQPVFAFLPLRTYGLKFILQGDFVLPSSREEVDGDSSWNQWLLSEFPSLFVSAERSFCDLPCFRENPGKGVQTFMSFVPLVGEVHGFFSSLPRMIISKLRLSNCLLLEGDKIEWVPPCKVLRNWNEQAHYLFPDNLLQEHLGLGFLSKDIVLSDSLARALGVEEYGPTLLLQIISSLCRSEKGINSMGLGWLAVWFNAIYLMLTNSSGHTSSDFLVGSDIVSNLRKLPCIPLSDGTCSSVDRGTIWLHSDTINPGTVHEHGPATFPKLYAKLRTVRSSLFSAAAGVDKSCFDTFSFENITKMLLRIGVQQLSAHEIVKLHILPAFHDRIEAIGNKDLMTEYLSFTMFHLQSSCPNCLVEREQIIAELRNNALVLTNHGYKRLADVPIHFSNALANPIDINKLINGIDVKWHEVDIAYLNHPITDSVSGGVSKWRNFLQELGVTDFVKIVQVEKNIADISHMFWVDGNSDITHLTMNEITGDNNMISLGTLARDWESEELVYLLKQLSSRGDLEKRRYFLEILDKLWDDYFSDKVTSYFSSSGERRIFKSSLIRTFWDVRWILSSMDSELHYPRDLFHDCQAVRSILGSNAPYTVPKVRSEKLLNDIGLKTQVTIDDVLSVLKAWRKSDKPLMASISQMSKFYAFVWNSMTTSKQKILEDLHAGPFIFVPTVRWSSHEDVLPGVLLSTEEAFWYDSTGTVNQLRVLHPEGALHTTQPFIKMLFDIYPTLHDFFVNECGVYDIPPSRSYFAILRQLSTVALPSQAANTVFKVFLKWTDELKSGFLSMEDVEHLKQSLLKMEYVVLPTTQDKWVSLHPSFGLICWSDDESLMKEFKHFENIDFLYFGELTDVENEILNKKVSTLFQMVGIPALSEVVTREAIYYGPADCSFKTSLVNWALPFAQRYILKVHPDKYHQFQKSELKSLHIVIVEKLFYRNVVKQCEIASKKRFECSCLLQGNILYATQESDSHSVFMELSRLLYNGTPDLHLANFLHMITTMAESGSTEEQTEFFILNSQKVPKLPVEESVWTLSSSVYSFETDPSLMVDMPSATIDEPNLVKLKRRPGINNWPPVDWKTAPGFDFAHTNLQKTQPGCSLKLREENNIAGASEETADVAPVNISYEWIKEDDPLAVPVAGSQDPEPSKDNSIQMSNNAAAAVNANAPGILNFNFRGVDQQLSFGARDVQQALLTGRQGEFVAFRHFVEKVGQPVVKWVNESAETGLPYDLIIGNNEYIEVKATKSTRKNWFEISAREWQFAAEKGESFSIAHVVLLGNNTARVTTYKNPIKLCLQGKLQLAVITPKLQELHPGGS